MEKFKENEVMPYQSHTVIIMMPIGQDKKFGDKWVDRNSEDSFLRERKYRMKKGQGNLWTLVEVSVIKTRPVDLGDRQKVDVVVDVVEHEVT